MADAADAVAEVAPEAAAAAEAVETPPAADQPGEPAGAETAAPAAVDAPDYSWIEEHGGVEAVREAAQFRENIKTQDGAIDAFVEFGVALGLTPAQLASLFPEEAAAAAAAAESEAEDDARPLTKAEIEQLIADSVLAPLQARDEQAKVDEIRTVVVGALEAKAVPEDARESVLKFADNHLAEEDRFDKAKVAAAVEQGVIDYEKWLDAQVAARIGRKVEQAAGVPAPVSGGATGGGEGEGEPMTLAEAKARVRKQYPSN